MSPRSPIFKSILWHAYRAGAFAGVTVQPRRGPARWPTIRFYFRTEFSQLKFAAKLEELSPTLARDHDLGTAVGELSGILFFVQLPLTSVRSAPRRPLAFALAGGLRGVPAVLSQLAAL